jgi:hypothetical protein
MSIDHLAFAERVEIGTEREQQIADCLNKYYGWRLEKASFEQDTEGKIDFIENGNKKVQIKTRDSGVDLLYDLFEPWTGNLETAVVGRDHKSNFDLYICLSKDKNWIRVAIGSALKRIVNECLVEWKTQGCQFSGRSWDSETHEGVQFRLHRDAKNRRLKVLAFIPDFTFGPKEFKKYKMVTT